MEMQSVTAKPVWKLTCSCELCNDTYCKELRVTRNTISAVEDNGSTGKSTRSGLECASYTPTAFEITEAFGGGSEYFQFWRVPLWPFTLIRLFKQEEE
jgi:hypothetical protein